VVAGCNVQGLCSANCLPDAKLTLLARRCQRVGVGIFTGFTTIRELDTATAAGLVLTVCLCGQGSLQCDGAGCHLRKSAGAYYVSTLPVRAVGVHLFHRLQARLLCFERTSHWCGHMWPCWSRLQEAKPTELHLLGAKRLHTLRLQTQNVHMYVSRLKSWISYTSRLHLHGVHRQLRSYLPQMRQPPQVLWVSGRASPAPVARASESGCIIARNRHNLNGTSSVHSCRDPSPVCLPPAVQSTDGVRSGCRRQAMGCRHAGSR